MEGFTTSIVSGLSIGALYAIMAIGLTVVYGVSRVFNFAHGHIAVAGGYVAWMLLSRGLAVGVLVSTLTMLVFGVLVYRFSIRYLLERPSAEFSTLLFTLGLAISLEFVLLQVFGPRIKSIPPFSDARIDLGIVGIGTHELILIALSVLIIGALAWFLRVTRTGQAMRAVAQSVDGARIVGIDIHRVFAYSFALAFVLTGISGIMLSTKSFMTPHIGWEFMIKGFIIVTFGGLGNVPGAVVAAFVLGMTEAMVTLVGGSLWVWPGWFIIFVLALSFRPQGILGGRA